MKAPFTRTVTTSVDYDVVTVSTKGIEVLDHLHLPDELDTATKRQSRRSTSAKRFSSSNLPEQRKSAIFPMRISWCIP